MFKSDLFQFDATKVDLILYLLTGILVSSLVQTAILARLWSTPESSTTAALKQSSPSRSRTPYRAHRSNSHSSSTASSSRSSSSDSSTRSELTSSSDGAPTTWSSTAVEQDGLLLRLPVELRIEIYKLLLVSSACVKNPGRCLKESKDRELAPSTIADIDATILRTCQSVYKDALPILYQSNRFSFTASGELISFAKDFGSFPRSSNHSDLLPSRLELIRSATLEFYFQQGRSEIRANGLEASAVSWRGWRSPYSEGLIFPHLCDLTLDFADWELSPNEKYFPKVMKQYLNNGFKDLDTLVLKGLEYRPDIVGLLESTMLKTGGKITVHFAYSGLRFGSPDGFRTSLLAKYKEHVKHPNNVDLVGFENRFDEDRSNEDRFKERHIQAERFEEDRFRRCLLAQHGEHVKDHYGYGKLYEEVCCEDDRQNLADLLATAALSTASE